MYIYNMMLNAEINKTMPFPTVHCIYCVVREGFAMVKKLCHSLPKNYENTCMHESKIYYPKKSGCVTSFSSHFCWANRPGVG